jgi:hypothetical protein
LVGQALLFYRTEDERRAYSGGKEFLMSTFPDGVFEYGGKPAGGRPLAMWPSEKVRFVDFDHGSVRGGGLSPSDACKYLDTAIADAGHNDVIYIRPRSPELGAGGAGPYYGGDPGDITPQTAATNWTIAYTLYGLSLIGTGAGFGHPGATQTCLQGGTTAGTPVLTINAPYVTLENLGFKPGSSTTGLIHAKFYDDSVTQAWAQSYYKLWLRNVDAQAGYSIRLDATSYDSIIGCYFSGHALGLSLYSGNANLARLVVRDCDFETAPATATAHIASSGVVTRVLFDRLTMMGTIPTGGSPNKYIYIASASTGMFSNSFIGAAETTVATNTTLNGLNYSDVSIGTGLKMIVT